MNNASNPTSLTAQRARQLQDPKLEQSLQEILQQVNLAALAGFDSIPIHGTMPKRLQQQLRDLGYEVQDYLGKISGRVSWHQELKEIEKPWC